VTAALLALALLAAPDAGVHERLREAVAEGKSGPEVLPLLVRALRQCPRQVRRERDEATAKRDTDDSLTAASLIVAIIEERPSAPEVRALAPELVRGFDCADAAVRRLCARGLGRLGSLDARVLDDVRGRLVADRRPDGRALAAAVLAATGSGDAKTLQALERALSDRAESVQLASASALVQLKRPERARPALQRLSGSQDPVIAAGAAGLLRSLP
jgi:HEAT repeat protein